MSDHYTCKQCLMRFDECTCPSAATIPPRPILTARESPRDATPTVPLRDPIDFTGRPLPGLTVDREGGFTRMALPSRSPALQGVEMQHRTSRERVTAWGVFSTPTGDRWTLVEWATGFFSLIEESKLSTPDAAAPLQGGLSGVR